MSMHTVLCVGGPMDGRWRAVEDQHFEVMELGNIQLPVADASPAVDPFTRHRYYVKPVAMFGFSFHVAICDKQFADMAERNKVVLRAILQRDVAAQMGVL